MLDKIHTHRSCSKYEQMVLQVLSSEFHRTGVEESSVGAVFRFEYQYLGAFFIRWSRSKLFYSNFTVLGNSRRGYKLKPCPCFLCPVWYHGKRALIDFDILSGTVAACARLSAMRLVLAENYRWPLVMALLILYQLYSCGSLTIKKWRNILTSLSSSPQARFGN